MKQFLVSNKRKEPRPAELSGIQAVAWMLTRYLQPVYLEEREDSEASDWTRTAIVRQSPRRGETR
jgi:hypothetical protein